MPAYHITRQACHSWSPDRPQGYVGKDHDSVLPRYLEMAQQYDGNLRQHQAKDAQRCDRPEKTYLPSHRGLHWMEGNAPPEELDALVM